MIFIEGLSPGGISLQNAVLRPVLTSKFSVSYPSPKHSQECVVTNPSCKGFMLPTAPPHGPQLGEVPRPPCCMLASAISSINNSIRFNAACVELYLLFWGTIGLLFPLSMKIRKPNRPCSFHCRLFQRAPRKWSLLGLPDLASRSELIRESNLMPWQCATASRSMHGCRALPGFGSAQQWCFHCPNWRLSAAL